MFDLVGGGVEPGEGLAEVDASYCQDKVEYELWRHFNAFKVVDPR